MKKFSFALTALATLIGLTACTQKPTEHAQNTTESTAADNDLPQIRIATESSFVPFSFKDADGKLIGFEIDLAEALCQEAKVKCEVISQDWDGLITGLQSQKYHAIMAGMSDSAERRKVVAFSDPYFINNLMIIGKKGVDKGADDLAGKNVAVQRATVALEYLEKNFPKATAKSYDTQENAYLDLEAGRADLMISDSAPALSWLKTPKGGNYEIKGEPININDKIAIAFRQNDPLIGQFNSALATLKANGTYDKIRQKYFADTSLNSMASTVGPTTTGQ
ncbi:extracellular solute-binding protein [Moraxella macacae 0408225]|uniref:Extracellular solute-binding protein n=1 Tax=Moraxella macacae 0408225 TaxID=1230338 RepID=L2F7D0_9GAMM|nr:transporter substrate-binding domain-containing protein [Moraxella macacae]ELA08368.1 extracellular solute-binding protein [Moraxella macacae 0408225]